MYTYVPECQPYADQQQNSFIEQNLDRGNDWSESLLPLNLALNSPRGRKFEKFLLSTRFGGVGHFLDWWLLSLLMFQKSLLSLSNLSSRHSNLLKNSVITL
jgi:hypothetical protein